MPSQLTLAFIGSVWVLLLAELVRRACRACRRTAWDLKVKRANRVQKCAGASRTSPGLRPMAPSAPKSLQLLI